MNIINRRHRQRSTRGHAHASSSKRWRVGNASVSTVELQAWQLGPAQIEHWLATEAPERRAQG
jgi:hypothetical protein